MAVLLSTRPGLRPSLDSDTLGVPTSRWEPPRPVTVCPSDTFRGSHTRWPLSCYYSEVENEMPPVSSVLRQLDRLLMLTHPSHAFSTPGSQGHQTGREAPGPSPWSPLHTSALPGEGTAVGKPEREVGRARRYKSIPGDILTCPPRQDWPSRVRGREVSGYGGKSGKVYQHFKSSCLLAQEPHL